MFAIRFLVKHWVRIVVSLLPMLFALGHVTNLVHIRAAQTLENLIYDTKLRAVMPLTLDKRIVIVDVDEKSLAEIGQWPWPRNKLTELTYELFENQKIALLGFDLVFAEKDTSSGLQQLNQLAKNELSEEASFQAIFKSLASTLDFDAQFGREIGQRNVVLSYYFTSDGQGRKSGVLPKPVITRDNPTSSTFKATLWDGFGSNIDILAAKAPKAGFFNAITDSDGVVRSVPLLASYGGNYYEAFSLALYRAILGSPVVQPGYAKGSAADHIENITLSNEKSDEKSDGKSVGHFKSIKVDNRAAALVSYRGLGGPEGGSYQYISASDVLNKRIDSQTLKGKIVLFGTSAPGLLDLRVTPVGQTYPGVEVHANLLSSMLDEKSLLVPDYALGFECALILFVGLSLAMSLPSLSAGKALGISVAMLFVTVALNIYLFVNHGLVFGLASLILMSLSTYMLNMSYGYFVESKSKRELTKLFGSYVPPQLVEEMLLSPSDHSMKAQNKELTVMFCDLRGFTQLSENLAPTQLQLMLNDLFGRITYIITGHRGTIDKYMGDSVMAFWGAPVNMKNHAELAVQSAIDIMQVVKLINQEHVVQGLPIVKLGIGINTGQMCVGDMGSFMRRSYTVVGDAVNVAARLESLTKKYDLPLLAGASTQASTETFNWQCVDCVALEGKSESLEIFTIQQV